MSGCARLWPPSCFRVSGLRKPLHAFLSFAGAGAEVLKSAGSPPLPSLAPGAAGRGQGSTSQAGLQGRSAPPRACDFTALSVCALALALGGPPWRPGRGPRGSGGPALVSRLLSSAFHMPDSRLRRLNLSLEISVPRGCSG